MFYKKKYQKLTILKIGWSKLHLSMKNNKSMLIFQIMTICGLFLLRELEIWFSNHILAKKITKTSKRRFLFKVPKSYPYFQIFPCVLFFSFWSSAFVCLFCFCVIRTELDSLVPYLCSSLSFSSPMIDWFINEKKKKKQHKKNGWR